LSQRIQRQDNVNINIEEFLNPIRNQLKILESRFDSKISRINENVEEFFNTLNDQIYNVKKKQDDD